MSIEVRNIDKRFGNFHALRNVNLNIASGELVALLGPSGCGKTTLLRIIAGLEAPDSGSIHFAGQDTTGVHVRERGVGFVFQHYALFKHMTVFDNVAFGLRMKPKKERPSEAQIRARVLELLSLVQLDWVAERFPAPWPCSRRCCFWMNPLALWMPRCAKSCAAGCAACTMSCM